MHVAAIPAFDDNYIWAIQPYAGSDAIIVDPGEAEPVRDWLSGHDVGIMAFFITHHHWDHINGLVDLLKDYDVPVYGPCGGHIQGVSRPLEHLERFSVDGDDREYTVFCTPGHTLDHICFYTPGHVFVGDTLFSAGCGRMFEGKPEQFHKSLQCLAELPDATNVYCAHEYTAANLEFALAAEPNNQEIRQYSEQVKALREHGLKTLPSTIGFEKQINPFLRAPTVAEFARLRQWKDQF